MNLVIFILNPLYLGFNSRQSDPQLNVFLLLMEIVESVLEISVDYKDLKISYIYNEGIVVGKL